MERIAASRVACPSRRCAYYGLKWLAKYSWYSEGRGAKTSKEVWGVC